MASWPALDGVSWRKSSHSGGSSGQCVEMAIAAVSAFRDSKNVVGPVLVFDHDTVGSFIKGVKAGAFAS